MDLENLSSNWKKLQATLKSNSQASTLSSSSKAISRPPERNLKRKRHEATPLQKKMTSSSFTRSASASADTVIEPQSPPSARPPPSRKAETPNEGLSPTVTAGKYIALDCEMVGVGPDPDKESALARVSIVNYDGDQIYDSYVQTKEPVTDWRTRWSGITAKHLQSARSFEEVQIDVANLLDDRILIGHAISNDLAALRLSYPKVHIRDTSKHPPFRRISAGSAPKLKVLASQLLGIEIQSGEHSSVEDARACMLLFRRDKDAFEREHAKRWPPKASQTSFNRNDQEKLKPKKRKKRKK
ncbi:MAG: hypothetical protein Q9227_002676 [Pyrenula ochraceoflavens]